MTVITPSVTPPKAPLVVAAAKMGYWKSSLDSSFPRAAELPFDSERKRMTTVHHLERYDPAVLAGLGSGRSSIHRLHQRQRGRTARCDDSYLGGG